MESTATIDGDIVHTNAHRRVDDVIFETKDGERIELSGDHLLDNESKSTSGVEAGTTEDAADINLDFLEFVDDSIYNRKFLDVKHDYRDALLCSLYTQVEFLKTELLEKNFLIRTLIERETEHAREIYNEREIRACVNCRCKANVNYETDEGIGTITSSPTESLKKVAKSINSISSNEGNTHCDHVGEGLIFGTLTSMRDGSLHCSVDSIRNSVDSYTQPFMSGTRDVVDCKRHSEAPTSDSIDIVRDNTELPGCKSDSENYNGGPEEAELNIKDPLRNRTKSTRNTRKPACDLSRGFTRNSKKYACDSSPDSTHSTRDSSKSSRVSSSESTDSAKSPCISSCESTDSARNSSNSACNNSCITQSTASLRCNSDQVDDGIKIKTNAISTPFVENTESSASDTLTFINPESKESTKNITSETANSIDEKRDTPKAIVTAAAEIAAISTSFIGNTETLSSGTFTSINPEPKGSKQNITSATVNSIDETHNSPKAIITAAGENNFVTVVRKKKEKHQQKQQKQQTEPTLIGNISYANTIKKPRKGDEMTNKKQPKTQQQPTRYHQTVNDKQINQAGKQPQTGKQSKKLNLNRKETDTQNAKGQLNNEKKGNTVNGKVKPHENVRVDEKKKGSSQTYIEGESKRPCPVINIYPERDRVKYHIPDNSKAFSYSDVASKRINATRQ